MKEIKLTRGYKTIVDDEDFEKLSKYKWQADFIRINYVRVRRDIRINKKRIYFNMARVIMNAPKGSFVDHINRNPLDNRKSNLRFCTRFENQHNRVINKNNVFGYKGVSLIKERYLKKPWRSIINLTIKGKKKHYFLGYFFTKEEAAKAYDKAAIKYFGKFAAPNFNYEP